MIQTLRSAEPFFTNDPIGFIKVIGVFALSMSPVYGLTIWWLKRGPEKDMAALRTDLNSLGSKVDDMRQDQEADRREMLTVQKQAGESHREVIQMLQASAQAIRTDIHAVDVRAARLEERSEIAEAFDRMGDKIVQAMRENRAQGRNNA